MDKSKFKNSDVYNSYTFFIRKQEKDESFESFLMDVFKLGKQCHFKNYHKQAVERLIRDKIIFGLKDPSIREKIFNKGFTELCDIINFCRIEEKKELQRNQSNHVLKDGNGRPAEKVKNSITKNPGNAASCSTTSPAVFVEETIDGDTIQENNDEMVLEKGEVLIGSPYFEEKNQNSMEDIQTEREKSTSTSFNDSGEHSHVNVRINEDSELHDDYNSNESKESENEDDNREIVTLETSDSEDSRNSRESNHSKQNETSSPRKIEADLFDNNFRTFFTCDNCGKKFTRRYKLNHHFIMCNYRSQSKNSRQIFECMTCPQSFSSQEDLDEHELMHPFTTSFRCDDCGRLHYTKHQLRTHLFRTHIKGDRNYFCDHCDRSFCFRSNLRDHVEKVHSKNSKQYKRIKSPKKRRSGRNSPY